MTKFLTIGSCLTGMPAIILNDEMGWQRLNNAYGGRSDYIVDAFIERSMVIPPREELLANLRWKDGAEQDGLRMLDECYRDRVGHIDTAPDAPGLFANLESGEVDVILLDNLHDTYSVLTQTKPNTVPVPYALPLSLSRFEDEADLFAHRFTYGDPLRPEQSAASWVKIMEYLLRVQPSARIYFFCAHALEGVHSEERIERADAFARLLPPLSAHLPVRIFPAMNPPADSMPDGDHYSFDLYRSMAGLIATHEAAGWHPNASDGTSALATSTPNSAPDDSTRASDTQLAEKLKVICDEEALEKNRKVVSPYSSLPSTNFWRRSVARINPDLVDPVVSSAFTITHDDRIATAGSCFAQHISKTLQSAGYHYLVPEAAPLTAGAQNENYSVFPARFGNIYTLRQLLQMFERAHGRFNPPDSVWQRTDGRWVDAFRPQVQTQGFTSEQEVLEDRAAHLGAVREMFASCSIFVFTLGLTEGWISERTGAVFPLPPGAVGVEMEDGVCRFVNFTCAQMSEDFRTFIALLRGINPTVKLVLTVSPVPLIATYEPQHVLVSNTYSKSALRVVAEEIARETPDCDYFPSYEIITAIHNKSRFYEDDLREVKPEGVANVMGVFKRHYMA